MSEREATFTVRQSEWDAMSDEGRAFLTELAGEAMKRLQEIPDRMKALTLIQPWASYIALGLKQHETRSWGTSYRGPIAIHAGKSTEALTLENIHYPLGRILAVANLVDVRRTEETRPLTAYDREFGDWTPGRFAWRFENIRQLKEPITAKGTLGLWTLPEEIVIPEAPECERHIWMEVWRRKPYNVAVVQCDKCGEYQKVDAFVHRGLP